MQHPMQFCYGYQHVAKFLVTIARGTHLFPFRTEPLSPAAPMVLPLGGRVGRRQVPMSPVTGW